MAATDAIPVPRKSTAYRVTFPIHDANGELASGAASLDSEVSRDGGAFSDATNEASAVGQGIYNLDLTAAEMSGDTVAVLVKSDQKPTSIVIYPEAEGDYRIDPNTVRDVILSDSTAFAGANVDAAVSSRLASADIDLTAGAVTVATNNDKTGYEISGVATTLDDLNDPSAGAVANAVWDEARSAHTSAGTFGEGVSVQTNNDKSGYEISGTITTLDGLNNFDPSADTVTVATVNDKTGYSLSESGVDDILDETYEGTTTFRQFLRLAASTLFGKSSGFGTATVNYRDEADSKNRVTATVDTTGNRNSVTLDKS